MRVVVAGAGMAGRRLVTRLTADRHEVVAIDLLHEVCELVSSKLGVAAICGNATDIATLEEAEIGAADVAVAMMRQSADNMAFCLLAKSAGANRIITRMANPKYAHAYQQAGVTTVIDVVGLFLDRLILEIERPEVHEIASFGAGTGSIISVTVPEKSRSVGRTIREISTDRRYPRHCLVAGIFRNDESEIIIPQGSERVRAGDRLIISTVTAEAKNAALFFEARKGISSLFGVRDESPRNGQSQDELDTVLETDDSNGDAAAV